ncbi:hypothetical protein BDV18DRAFT_131441 [Aspergillus unguis]
MIVLTSPSIRFLVMPLAFNAEGSSRVNETATVIGASVLIGAAYSSSLFLIVFYFSDRSFLIRSILVPSFVCSTLSLFNVLIHIFCRGLLPLALLEIMSLSLSGAFTLLYGLCALWLYSRDVNDTIAQSDQGTILLTDEEMQRQQLQRLLENSTRKSSSPKVVQKTYRVNHPNRLNSFLPPSHEEGYFGQH